MWKSHEKEHMCIQEDIDNVDEITTNTTTCPNCSQCIYKIDGCDQITCIQCSTIFSFENGEEDTGPIFSPYS